MGNVLQPCSVGRGYGAFSLREFQKNYRNIPVTSQI